MKHLAAGTVFAQIFVGTSTISCASLFFYLFLVFLLLFLPQMNRHAKTFTQAHTRTHTREFVLVIDLEMICGELGTPTRFLQWPIELNLPRSFPPPLHIGKKN